MFCDGTMSRRFLRLHARRLVASGVLFVSGCGNWVTHHGSPSRLSTIDDLERIRITRIDSTVVVVERPEFVGDSVVGTVQGTEPPDSFTVPIADIAGLERWRDETAAAVWLGVGTGLLALYALIQLPWNEDF